MPGPQDRNPFQHPFTHDKGSTTNQERLDAFHRRQENDLRRFDHEPPSTSARRRFQKDNNPHDSHNDHSVTNLEGWRDSEGDRLDDFGVDEDTEFRGEDDLPLAELLRRRQSKLRLQSE
jgi:palmitoyltransferase